MCTYVRVCLGVGHRVMCQFDLRNPGQSIFSKYLYGLKPLLALSYESARYRFMETEHGSDLTGLFEDLTHW